MPAKRIVNVWDAWGMRYSKKMPTCRQHAFGPVLEQSSGSLSERCTEGGSDLRCFTCPPLIITVRG